MKTNTTVDFSWSPPAGEISGASRTLSTDTDDPDRTVVAHQIELTTSLETE